MERANGNRLSSASLAVTASGLRIFSMVDSSDSATMWL